MSGNKTRGYKGGAVVGVLLYFIFFLYSVIAHFEFTVMGVSAPEVTQIATNLLLGPIILFEVKVLAAYLALGAVVGIVSAAMLVGIKDALGLEISRKKSALALALLILVLHFLVHGRAIVMYPQLFVEFMLEKGGLWKEVQILLTDRVGLLPFNISLVVFIGSGTGLWLRAIWRAGADEPKLRTRLKFGAVAILIVGMAWVTVFNRPVARKNRGPNLLLLCADSIRPDRLSAYGYERDTSPALDRLAQKGVRFQEAYVQLPRTFPSWVSMLTGQYPFQHGITSMFPSVADRQKDFRTLPKILGNNGWTSAVVADYAGDIFPRIDLGFDSVEAPDFNLHVLARLRGLEIHTPLLPYLANPVGRKIFPVLKEFAALGNPEFVERDVKKCLKQMQGEDKFMLAVFFSATHFPYSPPWPYYQRYAVPGYGGLSKYSKLNRINVEEKLTPTDIEQIGAVFDGAARSIDDAIAGIIEALERYGLSENTVVVFVSDHGENLYEHDRMMGHGDHLRGAQSLRVPLIIHDPRKRYPKKIISSRVRQIDLFPTLLEIMGLEPPDKIPAVSLVPLMEGKANDLDLPIYAETGLWFIDFGPGFFQKQRISYPDVTKICWFEDYYRNEIVIRDDWKNLTEVAKHRMLIKGNWKVIYIPLSSGVKWELYDLAEDPEELTDLSKQRPGELERMKLELFKVLSLRQGWTIAGGYFLPERTGWP